MTFYFLQWKRLKIEPLPLVVRRRNSVHALFILTLFLVGSWKPHFHTGASIPDAVKHISTPLSASGLDKQQLKEDVLDKQFRLWQPLCLQWKNGWGRRRSQFLGRCEDAITLPGNKAWAAHLFIFPFTVWASRGIYCCLFPCAKKPQNYVWNFKFVDRSSGDIFS